MLEEVLAVNLQIEAGSECLQELVNLFFGPVLERLLGTDSTLHHRVYSGMLWGSKKCFW